MPEIAQGVLFVAVIVGVAVAVGVGFGIVVAPRIGRALDRLEIDDEEASDGTD